MSICKNPDHSNVSPDLPLDFEQTGRGRPRLYCTPACSDWVNEHYLRVDGVLAPKPPTEFVIPGPAGAPTTTRSYAEAVGAVVRASREAGLPKGSPIRTALLTELPGQPRTESLDVVERKEYSRQTAQAGLIPVQEPREDKELGDGRVTDTSLRPGDERAGGRAGEAGSSHDDPMNARGAVSHADKSVARTQLRPRTHERARQRRFFEWLLDRPAWALNALRLAPWLNRPLLDENGRKATRSMFTYADVYLKQGDPQPMARLIEATDGKRAADRWRAEQAAERSLEQLRAERDAERHSRSEKWTYDPDVAEALGLPTPVEIEEPLGPEGEPA